MSRGSTRFRRAGRQRALVLGATSMVAIVTIVVAALRISAGSTTRRPQPEEVIVGPPDERPPPPVLYIDPERVKQSARDVLSAGFDHVEPRVRQAVLEFIRTADDADWQERLLAALDSEPDAQVRAWIAVALGVLGVSEARAPLRKLARQRPGEGERALRTWYDFALVQLGDRKAIRRLYKSARSRDITEALTAIVHLAEASEPGEQRVIKLLIAVAERERELHDLDRFAGLRILASLNRMGYRRARAALYQHLDSEDANIRLRAARHLAEHGDDAGKERLFELYHDLSSPLRAPAAAALVLLGEHIGQDLLLACASDDSSPHRVRCNRALGLIGDMDNVAPLEDLYDDRERVVGVAAASAVLFILGLEPRVLRRASIDWVRAALGADDWTTRRDATSVAASLPVEVGFPLLAEAVVDEHPEVRLHATRALAEVKTEDAARTVATALIAERDGGVREEQVMTLARIGNPVAAEALDELARGSDRLAALAEGARIAVLDRNRDADAIATAVGSLEQRYHKGPRAIRQAVMESATLADHRGAIPVLEQGLLDRVLAVRFSAAEGLAHYRVVTEAMVAVLRTVLSENSTWSGRAHAALTRISRAANPPAVPGEEPVVVEYRAEEVVEVLLDEPEPAVRAQAVATIAELASPVARTLLPRALADHDPQVRQAALDAVAVIARAEPKAAAHMLKKAIRDGDPALKAKAQAQLAEMRPKSAASQSPRVVDPLPDDRPDFDPAELNSEYERAHEMYRQLEAARVDVEKRGRDIATATDARIRNSGQVDELEAEGRKLERAQRQMAGLYAQLTAAVNEVHRRARSAPKDDTEIAAWVAEADDWRARSGEQLDRASRITRDTLDKLRGFVQAERSVHGDICMRGADTSLARGKLSSARDDLECAERIARKSPEYNPRLHYLWGLYYDERAQKSSRTRSKKRSLRKAMERYQRFVEVGDGFLVEQVRARHAELSGQMQAL